jgi:hypothetical protein
VNTLRTPYQLVFLLDDHTTSVLIGICTTSTLLLIFVRRQSPSDKRGSEREELEQGSDNQGEKNAGLGMGRNLAQ